ncbi:MAG: extracellular solute-binding protein, partial [Oscillospiraceae bacterium]
AAKITPIMFSDKDAWTADHMFAFTTGSWVPDFMQAYDDILMGKAHITENVAITEQAKRLVDLREQYGQPNTLGTGYSDAISAFSNGEAAMYLQGIWAIPAIKAANPEFEFSSFPLPFDKKEDCKVMMAVDFAIDISAGSAHKAEAMKFIEYMASEKAATKYSELDHSPSAIKGVETKLGEADPLAAYIKEGKTFPQLFNLQTTDISANQTAIVQGLFSDKDMDKFLRDMDALWYGAKK